MTVAWAFWIETLFKLSNSSPGGSSRKGWLVILVWEFDLIGSFAFAR